MESFGSGSDNRVFFTFAFSLHLSFTLLLMCKGNTNNNYLTQLYMSNISVSGDGTQRAERSEARCVTARTHETGNLKSDQYARA
jgi:hypothetical protein